MMLAENEPVYIAGRNKKTKQIKKKQMYGNPHTKTNLSKYTTFPYILMHIHHNYASALNFTQR